MANDLDPEFARIIASVDALEACAVEHESHQVGPHKGPCWSNRHYLAAMAMQALGLSVEDIGSVARELLEMEIDEADDAPPVDV